MYTPVVVYYYSFLFGVHFSFAQKRSTKYGPRSVRLLSSSLSSLLSREREKETKKEQKKKGTKGKGKGERQSVIFRVLYEKKEERKETVESAPKTQARESKRVRE